MPVHLSSVTSLCSRLRNQVNFFFGGGARRSTKTKECSLRGSAKTLPARGMGERCKFPYSGVRAPKVQVHFRSFSRAVMQSYYAKSCVLDYRSPDKFDELLRWRKDIFACQLLPWFHVSALTKRETIMKISIFGINDTREHINEIKFMAGQFLANFD